jgi:hypothetical protein
MQAKKEMVPLDGLEPPARGLGNRCSIHLSYRGMRSPKYTDPVSFEL